MRFLHGDTFVVRRFENYFNLKPLTNPLSRVLMFLVLGSTFIPKLTFLKLVLKLIFLKLILLFLPAVIFTLQ